MNRDEFWAVIENVDQRTGGDVLLKEQVLSEDLSKREAPEIRAFAGHLDELRGQAYTWPLWAAAYVIQGGCSDDAFMDLRCNLVFQGRDVYERAVANPDSLAALDDRTLNGLFYEGLLYVAYGLHETKAGPMTPPDPSSHPMEPTGEPWEEEDLGTLCPALSKRFGEEPLDGDPYG